VVKEWKSHLVESFDNRSVRNRSSYFSCGQSIMVLVMDIARLWGRIWFLGRSSLADTNVTLSRSRSLIDRSCDSIKILYPCVVQYNRADDITAGYSANDESHRPTTLFSSPSPSLGYIEENRSPIRVSEKRETTKPNSTDTMKIS